MAFWAALELACKEGERRAPEPVSSAAASREVVVTSSEARALLSRYECNRCHEGSAIGPAPADKQCVGCHKQVLAGTLDADPGLARKWRDNLHSLNTAPSLSAVGRKLRREFVYGMLRSPRDMRPELPATMPRLAMSEGEALTLAGALVPVEAVSVSFPAALQARGRELFGKLGCQSCHRFGARSAASASYWSKSGPKKPTPEARILAPDLVRTRERFQSGRLVAWLVDPQSIQKETLMPNFGLNERDARALASFLWHAPVEPASRTKMAARLAPLKRQVTWSEVRRRVFRKVCWHCHSAPDFARGDGGPGNTGGFGFPARGLDLSTYEGISSGSLGPDGRRRSIFAKDESGMSLLVRHLWARHREVALGEGGDHRGMPLGLPPMPPADIQLVETWIAQGRPRGKE